MAQIWLISLLNLILFQSQLMENSTNQSQSLRATLANKVSERRVVLLFGQRSRRFDLTVQEQRLALWKDQLAERDMDVIVLVNEELNPVDRQFLVQKFRLDPNTVFIGWLIGKDGGVKDTFTRPVDPDELFRVVDAMPMRRQEMKNE
jgi:hypothetical protein